MFVYCINPGVMDMYKYLLIFVSFFLTVLTIYNVLKHYNIFKTLFLFIIIYNVLIFFTSILLGGVLGFIIGIFFLKYYIKEI